MADQHAHPDDTTTHDAAPAAARPVERSLIERVGSVLPRTLMLMAIWGAAVFLWGTFGAWTRNQHMASEITVAEANARGLSGWLLNAVQPLQRLANDNRLAAGMDLPAGVESLPVQRVLYEYSYLTNQSEVYIVDMLRHKVGRTAGASALPADALKRLDELPIADRMVLGFGQRNGQMMLIYRVKAPLPQRLLVMVPVSLMTLGSTQPAPRLPAERELSVVVPHINGWAQWRTGTTGFVMNEALSAAIHRHDDVFEEIPHITVLARVQGVPDVWVGVEGPAGVGGTALLPKLLVLLWALMMSAVVLWTGGKGQRALLDKVMGPLGVVTGPIGNMLGGAWDSLSSKWKDAQDAPPLVAGPGAFDKDDFLDGDELARRANLEKRRPKSATEALKLASAGGAVPEKVERRKKKRGGLSGQRNDGPPMKWPDNQPPAPPPPPKPKREEPELDSEDLRAIVEDCLRKKRVKLLYQPIIRAGDNMPVMHEVYARLVKADGEVMQPNVFLPVALKYKLALELDLVVLRKVVNEHFTGGAHPATPLALNISSTSLDGIAYLQEMTNQGPRVLQKMSFEVRSQEMIRDPKALRLLKDLQKHGGNLAVDYFGGGVAMLEASKAMGFNYVKLNCMRLIDSEAGKKEMIMLCQHAQKIGLPIIMEMVGDKAAYEFAKRAGAEFLQGYALMRPQETVTTRPLTPDLDGIKNLAAIPL